MKQKIEKIKLKSGLEVVFLFDKAFTTSSLKMLFKIGWRNDTESERGLAHLFEHLVGKRTQLPDVERQLGPRVSWHQSFGRGDVQPRAIP
jgi:predicted Zn-dependent peptidase